MHARTLVVVGAMAASAVALAPAANATVPSKYANCTNLHRYYPHGIGRVGAHDHVAPGARPVTTFTKSTNGYNTAIQWNAGLDRDHDYIACEKA